MSAIEEILDLLTKAKRVAVGEYNRTKDSDLMQCILSVDDALVWLADAVADETEEPAP